MRIVRETEVCACAATDRLSGIVVSNEYDYLSRRIRKVSPDGNHVYFYDGWNLVIELIHRPDNTTDRIEYYWGPDISGTLQGAGGIGGLLYLKYNGAIYIPFYDAFGNILGYWNASGDVVATYTYDAFGKTISSTGPLADAFNFRYSTKYFDPETGLYYYGYRYYSPELRRWITRDPIEETGGINLYSMCENETVCSHDTVGNLGVKVRTRVRDTGFLVSLGISSGYSYEEVRKAEDVAIEFVDAVGFNGMLSGSYPNAYSFKKCDVIITLVILLNRGLIDQSAASKQNTYVYTLHKPGTVDLNLRGGSLEVRPKTGYIIYQSVMAHEMAHANYFLSKTLPDIKDTVEKMSARTEMEQDMVRSAIERVMRDHSKSDCEATNEATVKWFRNYGFKLEVNK